MSGKSKNRRQRRSSGEFYAWMSSHKNLNADWGHIALHWGETSSCWQEARPWQQPLTGRRGAVPAGDGHLAEDQRAPRPLIQPRAGWKHISPRHCARACPVYYWKNRAREIHPEAKQFWGDEGVTPNYASLARCPDQNLTEAGQNLVQAYLWSLKYWSSWFNLRLCTYISRRVPWQLAKWLKSLFSLFSLHPLTENVLILTIFIKLKMKMCSF